MSKNPALDRIDFEIVRALTKDARMSNKQIAAAVGLAQSTCLERIRSLRERGVLRGAHAEVDLAALGVGFEALLMVQLAKLGRDQVDRFVRSTAAAREVRSVFLITGRHDLVVHVAVETMDRLKQVISDRFHRHACVLRVETSMIFDHRVHHDLPVSS
jgi:DNA-binding Lrp family transcriptional regulator